MLRYAEIHALTNSISCKCLVYTGLFGHNSVKSFIRNHMHLTEHKVAVQSEQMQQLCA